MDARLAMPGMPKGFVIESMPEEYPTPRPAVITVDGSEPDFSWTPGGISTGFAEPKALSPGPLEVRVPEGFEVEREPVIPPGFVIESPRSHPGITEYPALEPKPNPSARLPTGPPETQPSGFAGSHPAGWEVPLPQGIESLPAVASPSGPISSLSWSAGGLSGDGPGPISPSPRGSGLFDDLVPSAPATKLSSEAREIQQYRNLPQFLNQAPAQDPYAGQPPAPPVMSVREADRLGLDRFDLDGVEVRRAKPNLIDGKEGLNPILLSPDGLSINDRQALIERQKSAAGNILQKDWRNLRDPAKAKAYNALEDEIRELEARQDAHRTAYAQWAHDLVSQKPGQFVGDDNQAHPLRSRTQQALEIVGSKMREVDGLMNNQVFRDWAWNNKRIAIDDGSTNDPAARGAAEEFLFSKPTAGEYSGDLLQRTWDGAMSLGPALIGAGGIVLKKAGAGNLGQHLIDAGLSLDTELQNREDPRRVGGLGQFGRASASGAGTIASALIPGTIVARGGKAAGLSEAGVKLLLKGYTLGSSAVSSAWDQYKDAKFQGASDDDATYAAGLAALTQAPLELLSPFPKWLNKLVEGQKVVAKRVLYESVLEAFSEAGTEGMQQLSANAIARAIYEKNRSLWEGLGESSGVGGFTGGVFSLLVNAATHGKASRAGHADRSGEPGASSRTPEGAPFQPEAAGNLIPIVGPSDPPVIQPKAAPRAAEPQTATRGEPGSPETSRWPAEPARWPVAANEDTDAYQPRRGPVAERNNALFGEGTEFDENPELASGEEIRGLEDRRAPGRAPAAPSPAPQPLTGRTLAIKQMLLEEQLAKIEQGLDQNRKPGASPEPAKQATSRSGKPVFAGLASSKRLREDLERNAKAGAPLTRDTLEEVVMYGREVYGAGIGQLKWVMDMHNDLGPEVTPLLRSMWDTLGPEWALDAAKKDASGKPGRRKAGSREIDLRDLRTGIIRAKLSEKPLDAETLRGVTEHGAKVFSQSNDALGWWLRMHRDLGSAAEIRLGDVWKAISVEAPRNFENRRTTGSGQQYGSENSHPDVRGADGDRRTEYQDRAAVGENLAKGMTNSSGREHDVLFDLQIPLYEPRASQDIGDGNANLNPSPTAVGRWEIAEGDLGGAGNAESRNGTASARRSGGKNDLPGRPLWKGSPPGEGKSAGSGPRPSKPPAVPKPLIGEAQRLGAAVHKPGMGFLEWAEGMVSHMGPEVASDLGYVWRTMRGGDAVKPPKSYLEAKGRMNRLSAERKRLEEQELLLSERVPPIDWRLRALRSRLSNFNEEARDAVSVGKNDQVTVVYIDDGLPQAMKEMVSKGAEIVRRFACSKFLPVAFSVEEAGHPDSHYRNNKMLLGTKASAAVVAHEIGHDISDRNKHVKKAALAFLMKRAEEGGKSTVSEISKNSQSTDIVYLDKWVERGGEAYTGRLYDDGGTEIVPMGIQRLNKDPIAFFEQDPEFFEFIVSILQQW